MVSSVSISAALGPGSARSGIRGERRAFRRSIVSVMENLLGISVARRTSSSHWPIRMRYILGSIEWAGVVRRLQYLGLRPKQRTAPPDSPSIAVIGNVPISPAGVRFIDVYSIVVRFNQCLHFRTCGTKTNILVF